MTIFDRAAALVALDDEDTAKGSVLIRSPGVLAALRTLFESVWEAARELAPR